MTVPEFKHLRKTQLIRRQKILLILVYLFAAIGIGSFVVFFRVHYKHDWSWLLIGLTYLLLAVNYGWHMRRIRTELRRREDRLHKLQEPSPDSQQ